ncbi:CBS domain-containing protein [bacterium]|nr:CBS domain-containing protein [bacterium]
MIWPHHIPTFPPLPATDGEQPLHPVERIAPADPPSPRNYSRKQVGMWMQRVVVTCTPEQTLGELMELLSLHQISGAPVVDEKGVMRGVVSQTDVAAYLGGLYTREVRSAQGFHQGRLSHFNPLEPRVRELLESTHVSELQSTTVYFVSPEDSLDQVMDIMLREHVHRLPVIEEGRLVGVVSTLDVLRILRNQRLLK